MANLIKDKIVNENKQLIVFNAVADFPVTGRTDTVYYAKTGTTSKTWSGSAYVTLSTASTDMAFYDTFSLFPGTGNVDTLYVNNDYNYVYTWSTGANQYVFIKQLSSINIQLMDQQFVTYTSPAVPPSGVRIDRTYTISFDNFGLYVYNGSSKSYVTESLMTKLFTPVGKLWTDIVGDGYVPPAPTVPNVAVDAFKLIYDTDNDGRVDLSADSNRLNGKLPSYYLDYNNLTNKVSKYYKWLETHTVNTGQNTMTLTGTYTSGDLLEVTDESYGVEWIKDVNWTIAGQVITFTDNMTENLTFKVINFGQ